jgi:hypothetical protein
MNNTLEDLTKLDAAPKRELAPHEIARRDQLLRQIVDSQKPALATATWTPGLRTRSHRKWIFGVTAALAMGAAAAGLVVATHPGDFLPRPGGAAAAAGPLTAVELASWTSTPKPLAISSAQGQQAEKWCLDSMTGGPGAESAATATNVDIRGNVASMIINRGGYAVLCVTGPGGGFWELDGTPSDPATDLASDAIDIESAGSHGDGATGLTYVEGHVGSDVKAISISDAGKKFTATVEDGRWTAWWPTADPHGTVTGTATITTTDGATHTVSGASLMQ